MDPSRRLIGLLMLVAAAALPACFAEDSVEYICHERGRSPAVIQAGPPVELSLQLACDDELAINRWALEAHSSSLGAPGGGAGLAADRPSGSGFTLTGTFTPASYLALDDLSVTATNDEGVHDVIVVVDWTSPP